MKNKDNKYRIWLKTFQPYATLPYKIEEYAKITHTKHQKCLDIHCWSEHAAGCLKIKCNTKTRSVSSVQQVGFFNIGSGRVLDKILSSGSGLGRVGVSKIRSGISGYLFYFRVFRVFPGMSGIFGYFCIFWLFSNTYWGLKILQQNQTGFR